MAEAFVVEIKPEDWAEQLGQKVQTVMRRAIELTAIDALGNVRREAPVDHGRLAGSFRLEQAGELAWRITTNVKYAIFVHQGHGEIRPVRAQALRFTVKGGGVVFARRVRPVPPNKFVERALAATAARVSEFGRIAAAEAGG